MTDLGKDAIIHCCATKGGAYNAVDGIDDMSFGPKRDDIETTDFNSASAGSGDYDEVHTFIKGLKNGTGTLSGQYEAGDTDGQVLIETACDAGTSMWFKFLWDGTNGHLVEALVDRDIKMGVAGAATITFTLQFISTWAATP